MRWKTRRTASRIRPLSWQSSRNASILPSDCSLSTAIGSPCLAKSTNDGLPPFVRRRLHRIRTLMTPIETKPRMTSFAPQFLVDDLARAIAYYQKLGFAFGEPWDGFYAIGYVDGLELHLKEAPRADAERRL